MELMHVEANEDIKGNTGILANGVIMITPAVGEDDYWLFRVPVGAGQYVTAFPKFGTVGIGFQIEDDWNTNLPWVCSAKNIATHIWHNRKPARITRADLIKAIELLQPLAQKFLHISDAEAKEMRARQEE